MYEKSSAAITRWPLRSTFSGPTSSAAASAMKAASAASLTKGGKRLRKSSSAVAPNPAATPLAMRRIFCSINVIHERAVVGGTVRAFESSTLTLIEQNMQRIASGVAAGFGATAELDFRNLFPPLVNDAAEAAFIADAAAELVGPENVDRNGHLVMASEDFSYMLNRRPGAYIGIGNGDEPGACQVHNPGYDFNDAILPLGASLFARLAERKLARG